ncbi:MAG: PD40 domain-containing protein [Salinivirgaceae bacterium]|nr:PD40 domain-containing protein [Salinivirgaceae bacterium]
MIKKALFTLCVFSLFTISCIAQTEVELMLTQKYAENSFRDGDYEFALDNYKVLYELDKENIDLNYKIGICYTEATIDKSKAIKYLEFVVGHNNYPLRAFYFLGRSYLYNYRFTEAVEAFYEYKMMGVSEDLLNESDRLILTCYDALERMNLPRNVTFELLDTTINSEFDEYYPFVSADNSAMVFSSNRTYVDDYEDYIANVFYSENKRGAWESAISIPVNTYDNEEVVGFMPNGEKLLIYADGDSFNNDIKMVNRKGSKFTDALSSELPYDLNTDGVEMGACLSPDGKVLYFASDRRGGRGQLDLYMAKKDASGQWKASENLGSMLNTQYDENFPSLSPDGKTLYFASKGHLGVGEYDLYSTQYIDSLKTWTTPRNLGFPINTPLDNTSISFTNTNTAYIAANRKEGIGKLDIYKVVFVDESQPVFVMGTVMIGSSLNSMPYSEDFLKAYATFYDIHGNIIARFPVGSDGTFFSQLYIGKYKLEVKFDGYDSGWVQDVILTKDHLDSGYRITIYLNQ